VIGTSFGVGGAVNGAVLIGDARETTRGALFVVGSPYWQPVVSEKE
jgi:hypothetical protein